MGCEVVTGMADRCSLVRVSSRPMGLGQGPGCVPFPYHTSVEFLAPYSSGTQLCFFAPVLGFRWHSDPTVEVRLFRREQQEPMHTLAVLLCVYLEMSIRWDSKPSCIVCDRQALVVYTAAGDR